MSLTREDLAELRRLKSLMSGDEWTAVEKYGVPNRAFVSFRLHALCEADTVVAEYIAALHNAATALLAAAERDAPKWQERPHCPGMWISLPDMKRVFQPQVVTLTKEDIQRGAPFFTTMVYGPIPEHKERERE